jgi:hypothetical protein
MAGGKVNTILLITGVWRPLVFQSWITQTISVSNKNQGTKYLGSYKDP